MKTFTCWLVALLSITVGALQAQEAAEAKKEKSTWSGNTSVSMIINDGNTNSKSTRVRGDVKKEYGWGHTEAYGEYNEGSSEGETNVRNSKGGTKVAWNLDERQYVYVGFETYKDQFKNLDRRNIASTGYGNKIINNDTTKFNAEAGVTYVYENFTLASSETYWGLRLADSFTHDLKSGVQLFQKGEYIPSVESSRKYTIESEQGVRSKLTDTVSLEVSVKLFYDNTVPRDSFGNPVLRANGHRVKRLDTIYYVSLSKTF